MPEVSRNENKKSHKATVHWIKQETLENTRKHIYHKDKHERRERISWNCSVGTNVHIKSLSPSRNEDTCKNVLSLAPLVLRWLLKTFSIHDQLQWNMNPSLNAVMTHVWVWFWSPCRALTENRCRPRLQVVIEAPPSYCAQWITECWSRRPLSPAWGTLPVGGGPHIHLHICSYIN